MNYVKNYIGKGTQNEKLNIVKVTLKAEDFEKHVYEYKGQKLLTFEVAELKEKDNFGRTHTAYVTTREKETETPAKPKPKRKKAKKETEDAPF